MSDCLVGCAREYQCGPNTVLRKPYDYDTLSPYVKVSFNEIDGDDRITVGNESYPARENQAVIIRFDYSISNGNSCEVEILDEQGGSFSNFLTEMLKCIEETSLKYKMKVEFGWIGTNCEEGPSIIQSPVVTFLLKQCDVSFSNGFIKYVAHGVDLLQPVFAGKETDSSGGDKIRKLPLKQAIRELFQDSEPRCDVAFLKKTKDGSIDTWKFNVGEDGEGPTDKWEADSQNKLAAAMAWLQPYRTEDDKGIVPAWDGIRNRLIFWEDFVPNCGESIPCEGNTAGIFFVNAGKCSNVLDFTPTFNWVVGSQVANAVGGQVLSETQETVEKKEDDKDDCDRKVKKVGVSEGVPVPDNANNAYGTDEGGKETSKSQKSNMHANTFFGGVKPISAELRMFGNPDPQFIDIVRRTQKPYCSVVVLNPFHLSNTGSNGCPEWLAEPICNPILTNKKWLMEGINHSIQNGSFTTTLKLTLPAPNVELSTNEPLGGVGSGGITLEVCEEG
jgi:hypothetical protein